MNLWNDNVKMDDKEIGFIIMSGLTGFSGGIFWL
jgi:hypothetical protein